MKPTPLVETNFECVCFTLFIPTRFLPSLASSDKTQNDEVSSSWSYARPRRTAVSPHPLGSALPPHPAALTTPPVFLGTHTIADGGKSQRYRSVWKVLLLCLWFLVQHTAQGGLEMVQSFCLLSISETVKMFLTHNV